MGNNSTITEPKPRPEKTTEINKDLAGAIRRLEDNPKLRTAVKEAIAAGGTGADVADRLADAGHKNTKGEAFDAATITQFKKAIKYLEG